MNKKKILFIGSGYVAKKLAHRALDYDHQITLTTTTEAKIPQLKAQFGGNVTVDKLLTEDLGKLQDLMADKDVVVVAVAPKKEKLGGLTFDDHFYREFRQAYYGTASHVCQAWQVSPQKPVVVYLSSHSVYPDSQDDILTEEAELTPRHQVAEILIEAEQMIHAHISNALIFRMGWILGKERAWANVLRSFKAFLPSYELPVSFVSRANMVNVEDVVSAVMTGIYRQWQGIFNLVNDAHPYWGTIFQFAAVASGLPEIVFAPEKENRWFEGDHIISNDKIKQQGFHFAHPRDMGFALGFDFDEPSDLMKSAYYSMTNRESILTNEEKDFFAKFLGHIQQNVAQLNDRSTTMTNTLRDADFRLDPFDQLVVLGGGFDLLPYRMYRDISQLTIFDIDITTVAKMKKMLLANLDKLDIAKGALGDLSLAKAYHLIGADLRSSEWEDMLCYQGFDCTKSTLWLAEGLFYFFNKENYDRLWQVISRLSAEGSQILYDLPRGDIQNHAFDLPANWHKEQDYAEDNPAFSVIQAVKEKDVE